MITLKSRFIFNALFVSLSFFLIWCSSESANESNDEETGTDEGDEPDDTDQNGKDSSKNGGKNNQKEETDPPADGDADADTDSDSDTDADTDADTDTDADADADETDSPDLPDAGDDSDAETGDTEPEPLAGCFESSELKAGNSTETVEVSSGTRTYLLHVPEGYTGEEPVPLVLDFHGLGLNPAAQQSLSGYLELSNKEGFIVAWPKGIDTAWNFGPCCTESREVDDVEFAKAIVEQIKKKGCIDPKRVYATGFSNGGGIAHYIACGAADVFAAVAPAAFDLVTEVECTPSRPITVIFFRGTNDSIVPYAGGASTPPTSAIGGYTLPAIHFLGAQGTFKEWAEIDGCTDDPVNSYSGGKYKCKSYSQCKEGVEVSLCISNATVGHAPGNPKIGWEVLKAHPMP